MRTAAVRRLTAAVLLALPAALYSADTPVTASRPAAAIDLDKGRIVFVVCHGGALIDTFDFARQRVKAEVARLDKTQSFAVITFSEEMNTLPAKDLAPATAEAKRDFVNLIDNTRAAGKTQDLLDPFKNAFVVAFARNPDVIVFVSHGSFSPQLVDEIAKLNKDKRVIIHALDLPLTGRNDSTTTYSNAMKSIAKQNGGAYRDIMEGVK